MTYKNLVIAVFWLFMAVEAGGFVFHKYKMSDVILEHTTWPWRAALCVWLFLHFVIEYWGQYR